jgi:hypothetical protein
MDKTIEGTNINTFYDISLYLLTATIYGHIEGPGDLLSWTRAPQCPASQDLSRDHWCRDAEPCDLPEIERTLETGYLMASEGQEPVPDASDPWLMTTGDLIDSINIDAVFWNARETTRSCRSTPQHPVTLSMNGKHMDMDT